MVRKSRFSQTLHATRDTLIRGGIVVMPTDTIYGIVTSALNRRSVERLYKVRRRNPAKPFIILINSLADLRRFGVRLDAKSLAVCKRLWPNKISIVLPCLSKKFSYLHRGTKSLAFRMPKPVWLRRLLKKTGPLVAPSANPEGLAPAQTIKQAKVYFGNQVDPYLNEGRKVSRPSTLVAVQDGHLVVLRAGVVKLKGKI